MNLIKQPTLFSLPHLALFLLLLSGCFKDGYIDMGSAGVDDGRLRFDASTGVPVTKAALGNPFSSTANLQRFGKFYVNAFTHDSLHLLYVGSIDPSTRTFMPGVAYLPLASIRKKTGHWLPGKRINYILNFDDGTTGSGGAGFDSSGRPILLPVRFSFQLTTVVEDWLNRVVPLITVDHSK